MRIAYILDTFPKLSETFILNEIIELIRNDHDVEVFLKSRIGIINKYKFMILPITGILMIVGELTSNLVYGNHLGWLDHMIIFIGIALIVYKHISINDKALTFCMILLLIPVILSFNYFSGNFIYDSNPFQLSDAQELNAIVGNYTENGSVIIACKFLTEVIDLHTTRYSISPYTTMDIDEVEYINGLKHLLDYNVSTYIINNSDKRDCSKYVTLTEKHFKLVPVGEIDANKLKLLKQCGREYCTIYKIERSETTEGIIK